MRKGNFSVHLKALGTVRPLAMVAVRPQLSGQLIEVAFHEGQYLKPGDFLAQIDPRPYQVALERAQAQLAKDQSNLNNAERDLQRYTLLVTQNSLARQKLDAQVAVVEQYRAVRASDEAQIAAQKLNISYAHIISPIEGRVGLRMVDAGNYVQPNDPNPIAVITQLQPISVVFPLPADKLPTISERLKRQTQLHVAAYDRVGGSKVATGVLATIDNQVDLSTATVKLRALFDNKEGTLYPNQFVNIRVQVEDLHDVILVPTAAVQHGTTGEFVYVVKPNNRVVVQPFRLGAGNGQLSEALSGLTPGDTVVVDGSDNLRNGARVTVFESEDEPARPTQGNGNGGGLRRGGIGRDAEGRGRTGSSGSGAAALVPQPVTKSGAAALVPQPVTKNELNLPLNGFGSKRRPGTQGSIR